MPKTHLSRFSFKLFSDNLLRTELMCAAWESKVGEWMRTSSMYVMVFVNPCMARSINLENEAGQPDRPMGDIIHWNWPMPGTVNAV